MEKSSILVQSGLKQQTTPQLPLPHGRSLKTNPAAQNNILRAFYRSRPPQICHNTQKPCRIFLAFNRSILKRSRCNRPRSGGDVIERSWKGGYLTLGRVGAARETFSRQGRLSRKMLMRLHHEKCSVQFILSRSLRDVEKKKKKCDGCKFLLHLQSTSFSAL